MAFSSHSKHFSIVCILIEKWMKICEWLAVDQLNVDFISVWILIFIVFVQHESNSDRNIVLYKLFALIVYVFVLLDGLFHRLNVVVIVDFFFQIHLLASSNKL